MYVRLVAILKVYPAIPGECLPLRDRAESWCLSYVGTEEKAEKFCALRLSEVERGEYPQSAKITLAQFGQQYIDYAKANKRSWLRDEQIMTHLNRSLGTTQLWNIGHCRSSDTSWIG